MKETELKCPDGWRQESWQAAMINANNATKDFIPNKIRNKETVLKSLQRKIKEKAK